MIPRVTACQPSLSFISPGACSNSRPLSWWCHPTILSSCPQSFPASGSSIELALHIKWPRYWSFSFSTSLFNECSELISFRIDWVDLLAIQGNFKSLLQHHNSKASVLQHSAFFMVQLSHPYIITGKTIALTIWTCALTVVKMCVCVWERKRERS